MSRVSIQGAWLYKVTTNCSEVTLLTVQRRRTGLKRCVTWSPRVKQGICILVMSICSVLFISWNFLLPLLQPYEEEVLHSAFTSTACLNWVRPLVVLCFGTPRLVSESGLRFHMESATLLRLLDHAMSRPGCTAVWSTAMGASQWRAAL